METGQRDAARKLLDLERQFPAGDFGPEDQARWEEYLRQVFGPALGPKRRSIRLAAGARCNVRAGSGRFPCRIVEVSYAGLTVAGEVFRYLRRDAAVSVEDVEGVSASLPCTAVRIDARTSPPIAGLVFSTEITDAAWRAYFDGAYYPQYIAHLESLSTEQARSAAKPKAKAKPAAKKAARPKKPVAKKKPTLKRKPVAKKKPAPKKKPVPQKKAKARGKKKR